MRKAVTPKTMELIKSSDLYFGRKGLWARWRARAIMKLAALDRINRLYSDALAYEGPYPEGLLHAMDVRTEVDPREADRIPPEGPAIVIANHPTGALDGIVLIDWLSKRRPDARFHGQLPAFEDRSAEALFHQRGPVRRESRRERLRHARGDAASVAGRTARDLPCGRSSDLAQRIPRHRRPRVAPGG